MNDATFESPPKRHRSSSLKVPTVRDRRRRYEQSLEAYQLQQSQRSSASEINQTNNVNDEEQLVEIRNRSQIIQPKTPVNIRRTTRSNDQRVVWKDFSPTTSNTAEIAYAEATTIKSSTTNNRSRNKRNRTNSNNDNIDELGADGDDDQVEHVDDVVVDALPPVGAIERLDENDEEEVDLQEAIHEKSVLARRDADLRIDFDNTIQLPRSTHALADKGVALVSNELARKKADALRVWEQVKRTKKVGGELSTREKNNYAHYNNLTFATDDTGQCTYDGAELFDTIRQLHDLADNVTESIFDALKKSIQKTTSNSHRSDANKIPSYETFNRLDKKIAIE